MIFKLRHIATHQATAVPPGEHWVGRDEDNYIQLEDATVSRHHARLINSPEGIFVEDADSANGTVVRGQVVQARTQVAFGDVVYFGQAGCKIEPEVVSEGVAPTAQDGLKPPNPNRRLFQKATERLPVARIHLDKASALAEEEPPAAPEPVPPAAPEPKASPVATPAAVAAAAREQRPVGNPIPVPTPERRHLPATALEPGGEEKVRYVVSFPTALWLTLFAGFGLGLLVGVVLGSSL